MEKILYMKKRTRVLYGGCIIVELAAVVLISSLIQAPAAEVLPGTQHPPLIARPVAFVLGACTGIFFVMLIHTVFKRKDWAAEDERTLDVSQKSALYAFTIVVPQLFVGYALLLMIDDDPGFGWNYYVRGTLFFVALSLLAVYSISYFVINRGMQKDG